MTVIGTLISDRFRLEEKIGAGGMSTVYRAFDPTLERSVAIKLMHRDISTDPDQLERFRREARAVASLNHPRARHHRLRLSGAGARPPGDRAVGHLLARHRPLRDAHRRDSVQRRHA